MKRKRNDGNKNEPPVKKKRLSSQRRRKSPIVRPKVSRDVPDSDEDSDSGSLTRRPRKKNTDWKKKKSPSFQQGILKVPRKRLRRRREATAAKPPKPKRPSFAEGRHPDSKKEARQTKLSFKKKSPKTSKKQRIPLESPKKLRRKSKTPVRCDDDIDEVLPQKKKGKDSLNLDSDESPTDNIPLKQFPKKLELTNSFSKEDDGEEQKDLAKADSLRDPMFSFLGLEESQKEDPDETLPLKRKKSTSPVRHYLSDDNDDAGGHRENPIAIDCSPEISSRLRQKNSPPKLKLTPKKKAKPKRSFTPEKEDNGRSFGVSKENGRALSPKKLNTLGSPKHLSLPKSVDSLPLSNNFPLYPTLHTEQQLTNSEFHLSEKEKFERNRKAFLSQYDQAHDKDKVDSDASYDSLSPAKNPETPKKIRLARQNSEDSDNRMIEPLQDSFDLFALNAEPLSQGSKSILVEPQTVSLSRLSPSSRKNSPAKIFPSSQELPSSASFDMSKPPPLEMSTQDRLAKMAQPDIVEENTPSLNIADIPSQDLKMTDEYIESLSHEKLLIYAKRLRDRLKKSSGGESLEIVESKTRVVLSIPSSIDDKSLEIIESKNRFRSSAHIPSIRPRTPPAGKLKKGHKYAFIDNARSAVARQEMTGVSCEDCGRFYKAIGKENLNGVDVCDCVNEVSRHRYRSKKHTSPKHFWSTDMPATPQTQSLG